MRRTLNPLALQTFRRMALAGLGQLAQANIAQLLNATAAKYGLPSALVLAVAQRESGLNPNALSSAGAVGVMQLEPQTAAQYGVTNLYDPAANIDAGVRYLRDLLAKYGDVGKALAAYNWGPGNVDKVISAYGGAWLNYAPAETQAYVLAIAGVQPSVISEPAATQQTAAPSAQDMVYNTATGQWEPAPVDTSALPGATALPFGLTKTQILGLTAAALFVYFLSD